MHHLETYLNDELRFLLPVTRSGFQLIKRLPMAPHLYYEDFFMLKRFSTAFLCGLAVAGQMCAQEVVVARETKPDAPKQATRPSEWTEPELGTSTRTKPHVREAKSASAVPTLEQMRMAGALAAERLEGRSLQEAS